MSGLTLCRIMIINKYYFIKRNRFINISGLEAELIRDEPSLSRVGGGGGVSGDPPVNVVIIHFDDQPHMEILIL